MPVKFVNQNKGKTNEHQGKHIYKSLSGESLKIQVRRAERCLEISVSNKDFRFRRQFFFYTIILVLSCLSMLFKLLCTLGNIAIMVVTSAFMYRLFKTVFEEKIVVIKNLGYQITNNSISGSTSWFIPYEKVHRIFLNEVIVRHKVIYSVTLLTKDKNGAEKLLPLFRVRQKPRRT